LLCLLLYSVKCVPLFSLKGIFENFVCLVVVQFSMSALALSGLLFFPCPQAASLVYYTFSPLSIPFLDFF